jgi:hypothetical protein
VALADEIASIDTAADSLRAAVVGFIAAGGSADTVGHWLVARVCGIDDRISRAVVREGNATVSGRKSWRKMSLAQALRGGA